MSIGILLVSYRGVHVTPHLQDFAILDKKLESEGGKSGVKIFFGPSKLRRCKFQNLNIIFFFYFYLKFFAQIKDSIPSFLTQYLE